MPLETVAILSPGDMGHSVGRALNNHGKQVITFLEGRSMRTRELAEQANIRDVPSMQDLVSQADLILSILVPSKAVEVSLQVAEALSSTGRDIAFADCNAVSPQNVVAISNNISSAGGRFIDASIIGGPPMRNSLPPRFYVSGQHSGIMDDLACDGIEICPLGDDIGRASAIKMCYAALTKGTQALQLALMIVAEAYGLADELASEFKFSQNEVYRRMESGLPSIPSKAYRWIGEMEEIAATFQAVGVTSFFHKGAGEIYKLLSETQLAKETPENIDATRTLEDMISLINNHLVRGKYKVD